MLRQPFFRDIDAHYRRRVENPARSGDRLDRHEKKAAAAGFEALVCALTPEAPA
jgi:hypothetical protein